MLIAFDGKPCDGSKLYFDASTVPNTLSNGDTVLNTFPSSIGKTSDTPSRAERAILESFASASGFLREPTNAFGRKCRGYVSTKQQANGRHDFVFEGSNPGSSVVDFEVSSKDGWVIEAAASTKDRNFATFIVNHRDMNSPSSFNPARMVP